MTNKLDELAFFDGEPRFKDKLFVGSPNIGDRERLIDRINTMLDCRWLSNNGSFVQEFERQIVAYLGVKHCIAVCNGTIALELTIRALELKGEVIIPSFTFIATAHALQWQNITPVFCDIDPEKQTINPRQVETLITPRTSGIIGVHIWGQSCDVEALAEIADKHQIKLMFDASHAFGCSHLGKMVGNFGRAEVFSFHATKFLNTFEGGAIVTNDDELNEKLRLMKNFGFVDYDEVIYLGTNGKMSEASAAMGLTSLESISDFMEVNRSNYYLYKKGLAGIPGISLYPFDEKEKYNYQYIVIEIDEEQAQISRDYLVKILHAENVIARRYFYPGCHRMEPYRSLFPHAGLLLHETEKLTQRVIVLPTGTNISEKEITQVCQVIQCAIACSKEIKKLAKHHD